jgi:hypothetical protein
VQVIGPAVQWADDVGLGIAASAQHDRLTVAADIRDQLDAVAGPHQGAALTFLGQGIVIAQARHGQLMRQVARSVLKDEFLFAAEQVFVEVGADRELRARALQSFQRDAQVRHDPQDLQKTCL